MVKLPTTAPQGSPECCPKILSPVFILEGRLPWPVIGVDRDAPRVKSMTDEGDDIGSQKRRGQSADEASALPSTSPIAYCPPLVRGNPLHQLHQAVQMSLLFANDGSDDLTIFVAHHLS
jgi:hypothetical protein